MNLRRAPKVPVPAEVIEDDEEERYQDDWKLAERIAHIPSEEQELLDSLPALARLMLSTKRAQIGDRRRLLAADRRALAVKLVIQRVGAPLLAAVCTITVTNLWQSILAFTHFLERMIHHH